MASALQPLTQMDFSGGMNAVSNPYLLLPKQSQRIRNMTLDEHGSLRTRDGSLTLSSAPDQSLPIVYHAILNQTSGASLPFAIQSAATGNPIYRTDTAPWLLIGGFTTQETIPFSVTIIDKELIANGYEVPRLWDGTTLVGIVADTGQTVPPGAKHLAFHLGSAWVWNTAATTSTLDGPSSLRMSDANNPNSWPNANQTFIAKDDGQVGMGLASYTIVETGISPLDTLIAFKNYSAYQISGVFGSTAPIPFSIQKVKSDMGCIAPRTIQFVSGFGIMRLTHKGFSLYNGVEDKLISEEIRPFIFGSEMLGISGLNFAAIDRSWAVQSQNPPLYIVACPTTSALLSRVFVYDLVRRAWTICDYPAPFTTLALIRTPTTQPQPRAATFGPTALVRIFSQDTTDDGVAVSWSVRTRPYFLGSMMRPSYWRRVIVDLLFLTPQTLSATGTMLGLTHNGAPSATLTFSGTESGALWAAAPTIWGQFTWGATRTADGRQSLDLMRTAPACTLDLAGLGPVRLRGLEVQVRQKPLTKTGVLV